jgi:energy-coupling factor transporter ATP-binding protein EcfA2
MNCQKCYTDLPAGAKFCPYCKNPVDPSLTNMERVTIPNDIARRAENFAGRLWVLQEVLDWLDKGTERFFLITGEPGSGKTTLTAWLAGAGIPPEDLEAAHSLERVRNAWHAAHFCLAEGRRGTVNPACFAQSLAKQLADRHEDYAKAALQILAPEITISQQARENRGQMVGAHIENLIVGHANVEDIYERVVCEPLKTICERQPNLCIFILVDALD